MSVFEISSTAHRSDKRSFALNRACLKGVQASIPGVLDQSIGPVAKFKKLYLQGNKKLQIKTTNQLVQGQNPLSIYHSIGLNALITNIYGF